MQAWDGSSPGQLSPAWRPRFTPYIAGIAETAVNVGIAGELAVALALFTSAVDCDGSLFGLLAQQVRINAGRWDGRSVSMASEPQWHHC